jgi:hypothetical protein
LWYFAKIGIGVTFLGKTFAEMSELERRENRARIRHGKAADFEADASGQQTPESRARDRHRAEQATKNEVATAARRRGFTGV